MRALIIGGGVPGCLVRALIQAGAEVETVEVPEGIAGKSPTSVIIDDISAASAIAMFSPGQLARDSSPRYGNPRPYLKRKKGRS